MDIQTYLPSGNLKPYIKCYWVYTINKESLADFIFPSGYIELAINISDGSLTTILGGRHIKMPGAEVLGQLSLPGTVTVTNGITLLVTRFYPHAGSIFFANDASGFTNNSIDLNDVFNNEATILHQQMMEQHSIDEKIAVLELFLIQKMKINEKKLSKLKLVERICKQIDHNPEFFTIENIALQYGFSERYIQKMFAEFVGLPPKVFYNIRRFNKSLQLVQSSGASLTAIAYACDYYDQSHFIKEFKSFTGITPSKFKEVTVRE